MEPIAAMLFLPPTRKKNHIENVWLLLDVVKLKITFSRGANGNYIKGVESCASRKIFSNLQSHFVGQMATFKYNI